MNVMTRTKPVENIFPLKMQPELVEPLNVFHAALTEMVYFGTVILEKEVEDNKADETLITKALFIRRTLEFVDAIASLIKLGISDTCEILLRSLFETTLGLEYLLKEDTDRRALCYQYCDYARTHKLYSRYKPEHEGYKEYSEDYEHGLFLKKVPVHQNLDSKIRIAEEWMNRIEHSEIKKEYDVLNKKNSDPKWYSLFNDHEKKDKLSTVQKLAKHLGKFDIYDIFYKEWSNPSHGTKIGIGSVVTISDNTLGIVQLRNPMKAELTTIMTARIGLLAFEAIADHIKLRDVMLFRHIIDWRRGYVENYLDKVRSYEIQFEKLSNFS